MVGIKCLEGTFIVDIKSVLYIEPMNDKTIRIVYKDASSYIEVNFKDEEQKLIAERVLASS